MSFFQRSPISHSHLYVFRRGLTPAATQYHENRECPERITGKIRYIKDSYRLVTFGEVVSRKNNEFRDCNHAFLKNNVILLDNTHREGYNIVAKDGDEYETIRND